MLAGMLVLTALVGRYGAEAPAGQIPTTNSSHLSINGVQLGMTRAQVEKHFPHTSHEAPALDQHFGMLPGTCGYLDGTSVRFDSLGVNAKVEAVSGVNLTFDGVPLCREMWGEQTPDPRPIDLKRKLGLPDDIEHTPDGIRWSYRRFRLSVYTSTQYPWHFYLGVQDKT